MTCPWSRVATASTIIPQTGKAEQSYNCYALLDPRKCFVSSKGQNTSSFNQAGITTSCFDPLVHLWQLVNQISWARYVNIRQKGQEFNVNPAPAKMSSKMSFSKLCLIIFSLSFSLSACKSFFLQLISWETCSTAWREGT